jgi:type VI secretion system protein VasG
MEKHHKVQILDEAIEAAVRLSHRYIPARQLPDKSVSLLDTACARGRDQPARGAGRGGRLPPRIEALETELEIIGRETAIGIDAQAREAQSQAAVAASANGWRAGARWGREKALVDKMLELRVALRAGAAPRGHRQRTEKAAARGCRNCAPRCQPR